MIKPVTNYLSTVPAAVAGVLDDLPSTRSVYGPATRIC
jgi:hypothetical protein